jgi:hypothetical protein
MATQAQIAANRLNAQKSTGPKSPEGKAKVAQNAVKHGLLARDAVIRGEDPDQFEAFRAEMIDELKPAGALESMLAGRIVGLSWRLRRAERFQNEVFDLLYLKEATFCYSEAVRLQKSDVAGEASADLVAGQITARDFANGGAFERLLMYERRIEQSLYRAMAELKKLQVLRAADRPKEEAMPEVSDEPSRQTKPIGNAESVTCEAEAEEEVPVGEAGGETNPMAGQEGEAGTTPCGDEPHAETRRHREQEREVCCLHG